MPTRISDTPRRGSPDRRRYSWTGAAPLTRVQGALSISREFLLCPGPEEESACCALPRNWQEVQDDLRYVNDVAPFRPGDRALPIMRRRFPPSRPSIPVCHCAFWNHAWELFALPRHLMPQEPGHSNHAQGYGRGARRVPAGGARPFKCASHKASFGGARGEYPRGA